MNTMTYKGYTARIEYDDEDKIFVGHLAGITDIVGFHGQSVKELELAFKESVDGYIEDCKKLGQSPNKPVSGKLLLRLPQEVHAAIVTQAQVSGKSINAWVTDVLKKNSHSHA